MRRTVFAGCLALATTLTTAPGESAELPHEITGRRSTAATAPAQHRRPDRHQRDREAHADDSGRAP